MHDNTLTLDNRDKFSYLAGRYGQLVKFYNAEKICADKIDEIKKSMPLAVSSRFTIGTFYRLFMPQLLAADIKKAIYLDSDIIVNLDINELWQIELADKPLAAFLEMEGGTTAQTLNTNAYLCREGIVKTEDYFNAGVLVMNLNVMRAEEKSILSGFNFAREHNQLNFSDQDILNYCFATRILHLPLKFNYSSGLSRHAGEKKPEEKIYHYGGGPHGNGVGLSKDDVLNRLWMHYFIKTPWFDEETIGKIYSGVQQMQIDLKNSMIQLSAAMSGKTRAFFVLPPNVDALKKIFSIRDDEEIILAENQESLQKLIDAMKLSAGKKIFFIMLPGFPLQILIQAGFVYGRDFLNGMDFLSEAHGVPFNSFPLIMSM